MSDELAIQQTQTNTTPYMVGGAVVGGAAGGLGAHHFTKPKYGSYEDIIKEAKDSADFSSKIDKAEGNDKTFLQAAKDVAGKQASAEAEYNKALEEYKAANAEGAPVETEEFKKKAQDLETKKANAIQKAEADLKANNTGELTDGQKKAKAHFDKQIQATETTKAKYITDREAAIKAFNAELQKPATPYTYKEFGKTMNAEGNAVEKLAQERKSFNTMIESIQSHLKDKKFKKGSELTFKDDKGKIVTRVPQNAHEVKLAKQYFEQQYQAKLNTVLPTIKDKAMREALMEDGVNVAQNLRTVNDSVATREKYITDEIAKLNTAKATVGNKAELTRVVGDAAKKAEAERNARSRALSIKIPESKLEKDWKNFGRDFEAEINTEKANITALEADIKAQEGIIAAERAKATPNTTVITAAENKINTNKKNILSSNRKIEGFGRLQQNIEPTIQGHYNTLVNKEIGEKTKELGTQNLHRDILRYEELAQKSAGSHTVSWGGWRHPGTFTIGGALTPKEETEFKEVAQRLTDAENTMGAKEFKAAETAAKKTNIAAIDTKIASLQGEIDTLNQKVADRAKANKEIARINKAFEGIAGKGAHVNAAGELVTADGKKFVPTTSFKLAAEVTAPVNDAYLTKLENTIAKLKAQLPVATKYTDEQIVQMAKEQVEKDLADDVKALEAERAKLPKAPAQTAEELEAAFNKAKGYESKSKFIEGQVEEASNKFKKEYAEKLARRFGFAEHAGLKIGAVAAAGALAVGALATMFAPKENA